MTETKNMNEEFGVIGLGRMGGNLARQAIRKGIRVVGLTREVAPDDLVKSGLVEIRSTFEFVKTLAAPRAIFIYIPAGPAIDSVLDDLAVHLEPGDVIVDGGNSYWCDSIRRYRRLLKDGLHLVDVGTSGGVEGALHGACFMVGGDAEGIGRVKAILKALAIEHGYVHAGPPGVGHFTKLVHNGIEFGMLQAIGEGIDLLEHYREPLNIPEILRCWCHGSVIRSWLINLMEAAYRKEGGLKKIPSFIEDTGEVNWLVSDALRMEVPVPVIAQSVMQLFTSRDDQKNWARAIAMMWHGFGGHPYGPSEPIRQERREGRIGEFLKDQA